MADPVLLVVVVVVADQPPAVALRLACSSATASSAPDMLPETLEQPPFPFLRHPVGLPRRVQAWTTRLAVVPWPADEGARAFPVIVREDRQC